MITGREAPLVGNRRPGAGALRRSREERGVDLFRAVCDMDPEGICPS
jgi:hypothetical protein